MNRHRATMDTPRPFDPLVIKLIGGRWTGPILQQLSGGGCRYQDLYDTLQGISYKVLTETLRRAERDGLITRQLDDRRIEKATLYKLTFLGRSLEVPIAAMANWSDQNRDTVEAARRRWEQMSHPQG